MAYNYKNGTKNKRQRWHNSINIGKSQNSYIAFAVCISIFSLCQAIEQRQYIYIYTCFSCDYKRVLSCAFDSRARTLSLSLAHTIYLSSVSPVPSIPHTQLLTFFRSFFSLSGSFCLIFLFSLDTFCSLLCSEFWSWYLWAGTNADIYFA